MATRVTPPPGSGSGRRRGSVMAWPWCRPPGPIPRTAASSPASGPSSSILSGISRSMPRIRPWRNTWARRAIRPSASSANTRGVQLRDRAGSWLRRVRGLSDDAPVPPGPDGPRELDPQESPRPRRFLRIQVDRRAISRTRRDQRGLPGLAGATSARSPLLRLPQLLRRPQPLCAAGRLRGPFRRPPRRPEDYRLLFDFTKLATAQGLAA